MQSSDMTENNKVKELTREQQLELESKAIEALVNMGVKFTVNMRIHPVNPPWYVRLWNRQFPAHVWVWRDSRIPADWDVQETDIPDPATQRMKRVYRRSFHVKPLYLGTIDCLRRLYLNIEFDEKEIEEHPTSESKRLFKYVPLMAEIAAVAVVNNPSVSNPLKSKEVRDLKAFFMENMTVSTLQKLSGMISQMMNPAGFISSIGSVREIGTTIPKANPVE